MGELNEIELKEVQRTWGLVSLNLRQHGIEILMALFKTYPSYKSLFVKFDGIDMEDLPNCPAMKAHASTLMNGVASFVDNLEDKDSLVFLVHDNVEMHLKVDIETNHYKNTLNLLPGYLQSQLGDELTPAGASGWKKVIATLCLLFDQEISAQKMKKK